MPRYVAFLRAINVGGHTVTMGELRAHFESLGFASVETFIASGNVIFSTTSGAVDRLAEKIEARLGKSLGYAVATFLRSDEEVAVVARYQPFPAQDLASAGAFCVGFLAQPLGREGERKLMAMTTLIDDFHVHGREVYWLCQKKQSESTFSNAALEKALGVRATFRSMSTIARLASKYPPARDLPRGPVPRCET